MKEYKRFGVNQYVGAFKAETQQSYFIAKSVGFFNFVLGESISVLLLVILCIT